jgi:hypothetical protein
VAKFVQTNPISASIPKSAKLTPRPKRNKSNQVTEREMNSAQQTCGKANEESKILDSVMGDPFTTFRCKTGQKGLKSRAASQKPKM